MPSIFNERPHQNEKAEALEYISKLIDDAREKSDNEAIPKLENLLRLVNGKRYGLVWEEHAELVDEKMKTEIPVFVEDETKKIVGNPDSQDYNFLLEGDNLHSLHLLQKTHAGKIDVIYIDPPYNTGNKDFIYNDKIVDKNDTFSHSKWLSFMNKRLEIAKDLLSELGVIFISIDDNEQGFFPDYIFKGIDGLTYIIETKGANKQNIDVYSEAKFKAIREWVENPKTNPNAAKFAFVRPVIKNGEVNRLLFNNTTWKEDTSDRNYWKPISELFGTDNLF